MLSPTVIYIGGMLVKLGVFGGVATAIIYGVNYFGSIDPDFKKKPNRNGGVEDAGELIRKRVRSEG